MRQDPSDPTGVVREGDDRKKSEPGLVRARNRKANAALQLRIAGADWHEVAEVLGFPSAYQARVQVEKALERELRESPQSRAQMRDLAGRRLERALRAVWPKAMDVNHPDQLVAIGRVRDLVDRHAKVFGYDAPAEVIVHSPSTAELEAWVARVLPQPTAEITEGDIFEADTIEGEVLDDDEEAEQATT